MFPGQKPDEEVVFVVRKHPVVLFRPLLYLTLLTIIPITAFIFFKFSSLFYYAILGWFVLGGLYLLNTWVCYSKTHYILTNQRLLGFERKHLFYRHTSETPLSKIQGVKATVKGFWPAIWNFGTVFISSSLQERIALEQVEEPEKLKEEVMECVRKAGQREGDEKESQGRKEEKESFWS